MYKNRVAAYVHIQNQQSTVFRSAVACIASRCQAKGESFAHTPHGQALKESNSASCRTVKLGTYYARAWDVLC